MWRPAPSRPGPKRDQVACRPSRSHKTSTRRSGASPMISPSPLGITRRRAHRRGSCGGAPATLTACRVPPARSSPSPSWRPLPSIGEERTAEAGEVLFRVGDRPTRSSRFSRARPRCSTPPATRSSATAPGLPRRDQPALRADGVPDRGRDRADALHRGRARGPARAAVRGRVARRPAALRVRRSGASCCRSAQGIGIEIIGARDSADDPPLVEFASAALPSPGDRAAEQRRRRRRAARPGEVPLVRLPGGEELRGRATASSPERSASASSSRRPRRSTCSSSAAARPASAPPSTAPPRGSIRS